MADDDTILPLKPAADRLRLGFLGWQCRLRQLAVRENEARPTMGMRPMLEVAGQEAGRVTVLLIPAEPEVSTSELRHIVRRTHDPRERYQAALRYLRSSHFQEPARFDDRPTALFAAGARLPQALDGRDDCVLAFEQYSQRYQLPCRTDLLDADDPAFQATYWHNALFNPNLPAEVQVVRFAPDWGRTEAVPPPR